jgi:copper transport protein
LFVLLAALAVIGLVAAPALAHVDLESSSPADGTVVTEVPELIELRFTSEAVPAGDGVVLASADGVTIEVTVSQPEPTVVHVAPAEPIANGVYGVLWTMRAGDAHPRTGTITFQVDAPPPPPVDETSGAISEDPVPTQEASSAQAELEPVFEVAESGSDMGDWLARLGRWAAMAGVLAGIGAFAFAATSLVGTRREVEEAGFWVRRSGMLIVAGTVLEALGTSMGYAGSVSGGFAPSSIVEVLAGSFGIAVALRIVGGVAMASGTTNSVSVASSPVASTVGGSSHGGSDVAVLDRDEPTYRLDVHHERVALIGIGLVAASYLFDGHTVTTAPNLLVRSASAVHVLAAGVWVGGVLLMAWTLARRYRRSVPLGAASMAIRFSRVASVALAAVAVAGTSLAIAILDSPSELFTTPWGRVLVVKVLAVAVAAGIGAYNHFVTVPMLDRDPADREAADRLRRLVGVEGAVLLVVVALTAILVGLAS